MFYCHLCGKPFNLHTRSHNYKCAFNKCLGSRTKVSDTILPTIYLLNRNGYKTIHCFSGELSEQEAYIVFDPIVHFYSFDNLPDKFILEVSQHRGLIIRRFLVPHDEKLQADRLNEVYADLLNWAENIKRINLLGIDISVPHDSNLPEVAKRYSEYLSINYKPFLFSDSKSARIQLLTALPTDKWQKIQDAANYLSDRLGFDKVSLFEPDPEDVLKTLSENYIHLL